MSCSTQLIQKKIFSPFLPYTDLQRELICNSLQDAGTEASVQLSEASLTWKIQQEAAARVHNKHPFPHDDRSVQHHLIPTPSTSLHFIPVNQFQCQRIPVTSDVFQLAPFKAPEKESRVSFSSSSFYSTPADAADVFLQAPFGKRQETTKSVPAYSCIFSSGPQQIRSSNRCHLVPVSSLAPPQPHNIQGPPLRMEAPLVQQPVAVHRVVSRIGQQAAVGSVAVGPLYSWTIGGRALDDPFTSAPFQPRGSQGKP